MATGYLASDLRLVRRNATMALSATPHRCTRARRMTMMGRSMAHVIRPDFGETRLDALQRHSFRYFLNETNSANGLVADRTQPGAPASIAAVGFALAAYWRCW
jgi:hypothetical protein